MLKTAKKNNNTVVFRDKLEGKVVAIKDRNDVVALKGDTQGHTCLFLSNGTAVQVSQRPSEVWRKLGWDD